MKVALFIPCYVDQLYPEVGLATLQVLRQVGAEVEFPRQQTCCGQPMANSGCAAEARPLAERFLRLFDRYEQVVAPSGSCVSMVRHHYRELLGQRPDLERVASRTFELCEWLVDVRGISRVEGEFRRRVGLHKSCHGLRELRLGKSSETVGAPFDKVRQLLAPLRGIELAELSRPDECCGFGGTFAVNEEAVSCMMGRDRLADHEKAGSEVITGVDVSCLMHLGGLARRDGRRVEVMHVARILSQARLS
ncbi:MAG TPA: (Fe-S)-binding protein [Anaeromyxobacteraceae bacterium]|nr:(Fe-S)-binding protein [Anaeromyxobacteraceae bacterium]